MMHGLVHCFRSGSDAMAELIEQGNLFFFYRNVVGVDRARSLDDVQHLHVILSPDGRRHARLLVVGRKRLPGIEAGRMDPSQRHWLMTLSAGRPEAVAAGLGALEYETATRGTRRQGEAVPAGAGRYAIETAGNESFLVYRLSEPRRPGEAQEALGIRGEAGYTIAVRNPDVEVPGFPREKPDYPAELRERFADLRWMEVSDPRLVDQERAQLVLIGAFGKVGRTKADLSGAPDLFGELGLERDAWPTEALEAGRFARVRHAPAAGAPAGDRSRGGRRGGRAALAADSAAGIARSLAGIRLPADPAELARHAGENDAPEGVVEILQRLPEGRYRTMADVLQGVAAAREGPWTCGICGARFDSASALERHRRTSHAGQALTAADLEKALAGVDFPRRPAELVRYARNRGHDEAADALDDLPERTYRDAAEVARAFGEIRRHEAKPATKPSRAGGAAAREALSAARIAELFTGISLPATAEELERHARDEANDVEMAIIERFGPGPYEDMADIARELGRVYRGAR